LKYGKKNTLSATQTYAIALVFMAMISVGLMVFGWFKKSNPLGRSYSGLMMVISAWIILFAVVLLVPESLTRLFSTLEYMAILALPVAWLMFAYAFSGIRGWNTPGSIIIILVLPVVLFVVAVIYPDTGLLYNHHAVFDHVPQVIFPNRTKLWLIIHIIIALTYFIVGTGLMLRKINNSPQVQSNQAVVLTIGVLVPWIGNITFILRIMPFHNFDLAPFVFALAGALLAWGLFYNRFINIINLAQRLLIERMSDGVIILDKQNWILDMNTVVQAIFRVQKANIIGQPIQNLLKPFPEIVPLMRHTTRKNEEIIIPQGNSMRYYNLDISPIFSDKGSNMGKMLLFKETTELKETMKRWEDASERARDAENLKSAFLANMSHEIKTPMNAIMGFSNLLDDSSVSENERQEFIDHIKNSGTSLLRLIDDIIDVSKLDSGQIELKKEAVSLRRLMSELYAHFSNEILESGRTTVDLVLGEDISKLNYFTIGDIERIRQVMFNLIDNAIKFTKTGQIEIGVTKQEGPFLEFYVTDTGIGIPYEKQQIIFERFGRVATTTQQEYSGTGLGLSLCKDLVRLFGGEIWVESIYGRGSTFFFTHPYQIPKAYQQGIKDFETIDLPVSPRLDDKTEHVTQPEPILEEPILEEPIPEEPIPEEPIPEEPILEEPKLEETKPDKPKAEELIDAELEVRMPETATPEELPPGLIFEPDQEPILTREEETKDMTTDILVIEYDDMSYLYMEMVARPTSMNLLRAKTLQQGMTLLKTGTRPNGILLSSELPDAHLHDACRTIKSRFPTIPIIALTPFASESKRAQCIQAGCTYVVPKPLKQKELLAALSNLDTVSRF